MWKKLESPSSPTRLESGVSAPMTFQKTSWCMQATVCWIMHCRCPSWRSGECQKVRWIQPQFIHEQGTNASTNLDQLLRFMQGCRVAYNSFVLYHNFRHAVDVLLSLFYFIVQIGTLPPYPPNSAPPPFSHDKSPVAKLLKPFDALTLLISAIGHDVGHPGVNNMFLVKLNAPLA